MAWGIDLFTRNVIFNCLPELDLGLFLDSEKNLENKNHFIENVFQRALNFLGEKGFDISQACKFIISNGPRIYERQYENKKHSWICK